jgi:acyl carrier protein
VSGAGVLERLLRIVVTVAGPSRTPTGAGPDTPICDNGFWLDSIALLELAVACEEEFDVDPAAGISPETPATARTLATIIEAKTPSSWEAP